MTKPGRHAAAAGPDAGARERGVAIGISAAFFLLWVVYGRIAIGTYNDDDLVHYFIAKRSLVDPSLWLGLWGRPLFTFLYAVPAALGYAAVEALTAAISAVTLFLTWKLASVVGVRQRLAAMIFVGFQPFVFKLGYAALVEPLGALAFTSALLAMLTRHDRTAALLVGLVPLTRLELVVVLPFVLVPLLRRRPLTALVCAAIPALVWNLGGLVAHGDPLWLLHQVTGGHVQRSLIGRPIHHYPAAFSLIFGGVLAPLLLAGLFSGWRDPDASRVSRLRWIFLTFFVGLSLLAWDAHDFGGSTGFFRHFVSVGPIAGVLAAFGFARAVAGKKLALAGALVGLGLAVLVPVFDLHLRVWEHPVNRAVEPWIFVIGAALVVGLVALRSRVGRLPVAVCVVLAGTTLVAEPPIGLHPERRLMREAARWVESNAPGRTIAVNHPWFFFFSGLDRYDRERCPVLNHETLRRLQPGSIVVWETHYGHRLSGDVHPSHFLEHGERFVPRAKDQVQTEEMGVPFAYLIFEVSAAAEDS